MSARTWLYVAAGVAGLVVAQRVLAGASAVGGVVGSVAGAVGSALQTVNPFNPGNVVNATANTVWERITGRPGQTIGLSIEELFTNKPASITYSADADDAYLGAAMRAAEPSYFQRRQAVRDAGPWSAVDQEDADMGAAMRSGGFDYITPPNLGAAWPASIPRRP